MKEIDDANRLMWEGKKKEADLLLRQAISSAYSDASVYRDAISIYMLGKMYNEAKQLFAQYKSRNGKALNRTDFSLTEIDQEQQEALQAEREIDFSKSKLFKRERGCLSVRHHPFAQIREIEIQEDEIILRKGRKELRFPWSEIKEALITSRWRFGSEYSGDRVEKTFHLVTPSGIFRFDVSEDGADFKHSDLLVDQLKRHLQVKIEQVIKPITLLGFEPWWWLIVVGTLVYFLWKYFPGLNIWIERMRDL